MKFTPHNNIDDNTWSVALYVRLSDEDRNKKNELSLSRSIENQITQLENALSYMNENPNEKYKLVLYDVYADDDYTGLNFDRPDYQRLERDIRQNKVDCIIVKNLSRFGRDDREVQEYLENTFEIKGREVRFIAVGDNFDSLYDDVNLEVKIKLILNRDYSDTQHKNVCAGMLASQRKGKFVGAFAPYGYAKNPDNKHQLIVDYIAAGVVRRIYKEYLSGKSLKLIAKGLSKEGIVNPSAYKKLNNSNFRCGKKLSDNMIWWNSDTVKRILQDEVYTGTLVQHKQSKRRVTDKRPVKLPREEWIRCEGTHEAIVAKEEWLTAQGMMKTIQRDRSKPDEVTIFKGLLKCGDCQRAMRKRCDSYKSKRTGKAAGYLYYNCSTFRDHGREACSGHYISDKVLRTIVINDINVIISQVGNLKALAGKAGAAGIDNRHSIEMEIKVKENKSETYKNRLKAAKDKLLDGVFGNDEYRETKAEIERDIKYIEKQIDMLKKSITDVPAELNNPWVNELLSAGRLTDLDRATVVALIDTIYVYEDRHIEIVYRFSDEYDHLFAKILS